MGFTVEVRHFCLSNTVLAVCFPKFLVNRVMFKGKSREMGISVRHTPRVLFAASTPCFT